MNRELAEVRRYWPRAKYDPSCLYQYSAAGSLIGLMILGGKAEIARAVGQQWIRCRGSTIAEAMRAAGFRVRLPGIMAIYRRGPARVPLADRQRPRKGARLGRRKRKFCRLCGGTCDRPEPYERHWQDGDGYWFVYTDWCSHEFHNTEVQP